MSDEAVPWSYGPAARLMRLRPPLAAGGHSFKLHGAAATCLRCYVSLPLADVTDDRLWDEHGLLRFCPGLMRQLTA